MNSTVTMRSDHPLSTAWSLHPLFGFIGTILNGAVLLLFIKERKTFIRIINLTFWMEVVYRILLTSIAIPWKGYIIGHDKGLFSFWFSNKMECMFMTVFATLLSVGMWIYLSFGSMIRFLFVTNQGFSIHCNRNRIFYFLIYFPQFLIMIHLANLIKLYVTQGAEGFYFVMHQACMDPWSDFEMAYYKFMPLDQIMMYSYIMIDVVSNFYLCYFMSIHDQTNSAVRKGKTSREIRRQRNFVPAKRGIMIIMILLVFWILNVTGYNMASYTNLNLDSSTKAYILNFYNDLVISIILPLVTLYSAPTVMNNLKNLKVGERLTLLVSNGVKSSLTESILSDDIV